MKLVVTGANGFVGRAVVSLARAQGIDVHELTRGGSSSVATQWHLGEPLPDSCKSASCVIHLASAALTETHHPLDALERDVAGTRILIDSIRRLRLEGRQVRFVFVSSQSANPQARNLYGMSKWQIEQMLDRREEIIVRPGLVYAIRSHSVAGLLEKLSSFRILPVLETEPNIQPIHVSELAHCLLRISTADEVLRLYQLGATSPITFKEAIQATARRMGKPPPVMVSMPYQLVRQAARVIDGLGELRPLLTERVEGLVALKAMDTRSSLSSIGVELKPFDHAG